MSNKKCTSCQQERREKYKGPHQKDSSHYISAEERSYFNLPNRNDNLDNYRMQKTTTNRSNHTVIDNYLLKNSPNHSMEYVPLEAKNNTVYKEEIASRVQQKIDVAKSTGDIQNDRFRQYLKKAADACDLDLRQFNGY